LSKIRIFRFYFQIRTERDYTPSYAHANSKCIFVVVDDTRDPYYFDAFVLADRTDILLVIYKYCKQTTTIVTGTNGYIFTQVMCLKYKTLLNLRSIPVRRARAEVGITRALFYSFGHLFVFANDSRFILLHLEWAAKKTLSLIFSFAFNSLLHFSAYVTNDISNPNSNLFSN
jgi:hypothetical protein